MISEKIVDYLGELKTWEMASDKCREAFLLEMSNKNYGSDETFDAWIWFFRGWSLAGGGHRT